MKKILLVFLLISLLLFSACNDKESDSSDNFALEEGRSISNSEDESVEEEKVEENNNIDDFATESTLSAEAIPETTALKSNLNLSKFKFSDNSSKYDAYLNEAIPLGLVGEYWSSPEEIDAERVLSSIDYFNSPNFSYPSDFDPLDFDEDNPPTFDYYIEETEIENYVLSKVDISVSQLRNTRFYSEGRYNFIMIMGKGGMMPISMSNSWELDGYSYIELISLIDESKSVLKIDSNGKFVSYTAQE